MVRVQDAPSYYLPMCKNCIAEQKGSKIGIKKKKRGVKVEKINE